MVLVGATRWGKVGWRDGGLNLAYVIARNLSGLEENLPALASPSSHNCQLHPSDVSQQSQIQVAPTYLLILLLRK